jgi:hypothetical protein
MWAEITRLGGSRIELERLVCHPGYLCDPSATPAESALAFEDERSTDDPRGHRRFWQDTVAWLVQHRDELTEDTCELILDWALHRRTEDIARDLAESQRFSWRGRSPARLIEQAREYRQAMTYRWWYGGGPVTWRSRGWGWEERTLDGVWSVRELVSSTELCEESAAMRHCVASYVFRCVQDRSAIVSVAYDGERRFTVEVDPLTRRVVQARGHRNRACTREELAVIDRWLAAIAIR